MTRLREVGSILGKYAEIWITLLALILLIAILVIWLVSPADLTAIRDYGLLIAAIIAFPLGFWRSRVAERQADAAQRQVKATQQQLNTAQRQAEAAHRQVETAEQSLLNERYQRGAEMLGSDVLSVRLGGIYALDRLAAEQPDSYHIQIMQLFCAFARRPHQHNDDKPPNPQELTSDYALGGDQSGVRNPVLIAEYNRAISPSLDIQAVMEAICLRDEVRREKELTEDFRVNLSESNLSRLALVKTPANLSLATMWAVNLSGAHLPFANLQSAVLSNATLSHANLLGADLSDANLRDSDLSVTVLSTANLNGALLLRADLSNAKVTGTSFSGAVLKDSILSGTDFNGMPLPQEALNVINNHLPAIAPEVSKANLSATGLTQSQLDEAGADPSNPPKLDGLVDAETGKPLVWHGKPLHDQA